jgi:hypothetical protein
VYLGYVIGGGELKIDPTKMEAIMKWCYPHFLGITKEMMSRGPQVADMEYRETDG